MALTVSMSVDTPCMDKFYSNVVRDTTHVGAAFVKLNIVDSAGNNKSILTPNYTLYYFFNHNDGMSHESYQKFMRDVLSSRNRLNFQSYQKLPGHINLAEDEYVERIGRKGKKKFINHFFDNNIFKFKHQRHFEAVVAKLFDLGVLVSFVHNGSRAIIYDAGCF